MRLIVHEHRAARGYIGPCEHLTCDKPAVATLILAVDGVLVHTWVCAQHRDDLVGRQAAA